MPTVHCSLLYCSGFNNNQCGGTYKYNRYKSGISNNNLIHKSINKCLIIVKNKIKKCAVSKLFYYVLLRRLFRIPDYSRDTSSVCVHCQQP